LIPNCIITESNSPQPEIEKSSLDIYPNPVHDILQIDLKKFGSSQIDLIVCDGSGKVIFKKSVTGNEQQLLDVSGLKAGSYVLTILSGNDNESVKFIKN